MQLQKLPGWIEQRRANAAVLNRRLGEYASVRLTLPPEDIYHSYYKYYVFVRSEKLKEGWSRDRIMNEIAAQGVPAFSGSCSEIYLEKAFSDAGYGPQERLPVAKELGETSLMFLVHPTLSEADVEGMADVVCAVLEEATL